MKYSPWPVLLLLICGYFMSPLRAEERLEIIPLKHLTAEQAIVMIKPLVDREGAVTGMNNQLIVRASPDNIKQIKEALLNFDVAPQRLLITVKQDTRKDRIERHSGLSARGRVDTVTGSLGEQQGVPSNEVELRINRTDSQQDDLHTQQIQVLEGSEALIQVGQSVPVAESRLEVDGAYPRTYSSIRYKDLTTGFTVIPRLNGDTVTLQISPHSAKLSEQGGGRIEVQQMHTTVSGQLGEWIEVGGNARQQNDSTQGILYSTKDLANDERKVFLKVERLDNTQLR